MSITTTAYGEAIILRALGYALGWRNQNCVEDNVSCYKYLFENNYNSVIGNPWCAFLATKVVNDAADEIGIYCPLPFQGSSAAIVTRAKKLGIRVDKTPAIGSIFYYTREGGGHVGIVVWMNNVGMFTVEGNSDDKLKCIGCPVNAVIPIGSNSTRTYKAMENKGAVYVHIEEVGDTDKVVIENAFNMPVSPGQQRERTLNAGMSGAQLLLMLSLLGGGIYAATKS